MKQKNNLPYIIILVIGLLAITFAGIKFFKKSNQSSTQASESQGSSSPNNAGQGSGTGRGQRGANRGNFKPLHGTVTSVSSDTITMKADDASTKNIAVSSTTRISKTDNGQRVTLTISDIKTGDEINVMAQDTTTSNITARMIIIGTFTPPQRSGSSQSGGYNNDQSQTTPQDNTTGTSSL